MTKRQSTIDFDHHRVGSILACLPKHLREPIIEILQTQDPNIGHLALRFEDLLHADEQGLNTLLKQTDKDDLAYAMITASTPLQQKIYTTLSKHQSKRQSELLSNQVAQITNIQSNTAGYQQPYEKKSYNQQHHLYHGSGQNELDQQQQNEIELDSKDAQLSIISLAAKLRQQQKLTLDPPGIAPDLIDEQHINNINKEMQIACENAMAQVLSNHPPEAAAAVLCRRLDRHLILSQMLDLEGLESLESPRSRRNRTTTTKLNGHRRGKGLVITLR